MVRHGRNHPISTGATAWSSDNLSARIHVRHGTTFGVYAFSNICDWSYSAACVFGIKVVFKGVTKKPCYSIARYINCYRQFTITTFDLASTMLLIFLVTSFQLICVVVHTTDGTEELPVKLPVSKPSLYSLFQTCFIPCRS